MDRGRTATLLDSTGAAVALWQPGARLGAGVEGSKGSICWHDLNTCKPKEAIKFYTKVFGWKLKEMDFGGNPYYQMMLGKKPWVASGLFPWKR